MSGKPKGNWTKKHRLLFHRIQITAMLPQKFLKDHLVLIYIRLKLNEKKFKASTAGDFFIMKYFLIPANRPRKRSNSMVNRWMQIVMERPKRLFVMKWKSFLKNQFWLSWVLNHQIHSLFNLVCPSQGQFLTFHDFIFPKNNRFW